MLVFRSWEVWALGVQKIWPKHIQTQKLANVGFAKVGQHSETLKLAKVGLAIKPTIGQSRSKNWPKSAMTPGTPRDPPWALLERDTIEANKKSYFNLWKKKDRNGKKT